MIEDEISILDTEIDSYAERQGMARNDFLQALDIVQPDVAAAMIPLLRRRIDLSKQLWTIRSRVNDLQNVLLFSRPR